MKTKLLTLLTLAFLGLSTANAQVGIGTTNPENTAALDVDATDKGFLPPRMDTGQRDAINGGTIAPGLVIYNTDVHCLQWYDGTDWFDPCEEPTSGGGGGQQDQGLNLDPLPTGITLQAIEDYSIASAYDDDYLDASGDLVINGTEAELPTDPFTGGPNPNNEADGTTETLIDFQGTLTTTGVTLNIPYETTGAVTLPAYSQTLSIFSDFTENGQDTDVTFSYPETTITTADTGFIQATLKADTSDLLARKLDLNSGFGPDYLGLVIEKFSYALDDQATQADFFLRIIPGIPDKNIGDGVHDFIYLPITSTPTGKTWLNNNLGANYANINDAAFDPAEQGTASNDFNAYGSLFQWGRVADGHEIINWTSSTASDGVEQSNETTTTSSTPEPATSEFIKGSANWYTGSSPAADDLWQENTKTTYDPCPNGFRVPTQAEWQAEIDDGTWSNASDAYNSDLALPVAGYRSPSTGNLAVVGSTGYYWSSTVSGTSAFRLAFNSSIASMNSFNRAYGVSVRCIQE